MKIHTKTVLADIDIPEHPKGIIHFIHGMMEEITDYEFLVKQITQNGYICVRQEITGHGELAVNEKKGYMGKSPVGWNQAVLSIQEVYQQVRNVCGTQYPYFMIGFSLGSFLLRQAFLTSDALSGVNGVCLIGTGNKSFVELKIAEIIAKQKCKRYGEDNTSGVVDDLMMGNYNRKIKNETGDYRWLFSDKKCAERFDPHGYTATPQLFYDFVHCMESVRTKAGVLCNIPLLLLSGEEDPVTGNMTSLVKQFRKMGCKDVKAVTIPEKRHHILRDADWEISLKPFWDWIAKREE